MGILFFLGIIIAVLAAIFAWQNPGYITIHYFNTKFEGSLALVCLLIFALGFLTNAMFSMGAYFRLKWQNRSLRKRIADLEVQMSPKKKAEPLFEDPPDIFRR